MSANANIFRPAYNPLAFNPGAARHTIQLCHASTTQDASGQPIDAWIPYLTCNAEIRMLSGQELFQADQFSGAAQYRVRLRWPGPSITVSVGDRILFGAHAYVVQIVNNVLLRNIVIELTCLEVNGSS